MKISILIYLFVTFFLFNIQNEEIFEGNILYQVNTPSGEVDTLLIQLRENSAKVTYGKLARRYGMDTMYITLSNNKVKVYYYSNMTKKLDNIKISDKVEISSLDNKIDILEYTCNSFLLEYEGMMYEDVHFNQKYQIFCSNELTSPIHNNMIFHPFIGNSTNKIALKVIQENYEDEVLISKTNYTAIQIELDTSSIFFPEINMENEK